VQVVLSRRFDRGLQADPLLAYRALRAVSPAPYHALLRLDGVHVVGASPEELVGVIGGRVTTHPIAGTRPRAADPIEDVRLEQELLADHKERCEHMMLVDLGRNDVGRVARIGSLRVVRLCEVERFSHVMHLVSRVSGELRDGLHPVDALRAAFPAGTLTGAPRVRAMQLIAELEQDERGPYGGVIGYVGHGRVLDMAITIRSAILAHGRAHVQAGAGIVAASDPASEAAETRHKARSVLAALALAERTHASLPTPVAEVVA
jgi:anthranilate synthase component 1